MDIAISMILIVVVGIVSAVATASVKNKELRSSDRKYANKIAEIADKNNQKTFELIQAHKEEIADLSNKCVWLGKYVYELAHDTMKSEEEMEVEVIAESELEKAFRNRAEKRNE